MIGWQDPWSDSFLSVVQRKNANVLLYRLFFSSVDWEGRVCLPISILSVVRTVVMWQMNETDWLVWILCSLVIFVLWVTYADIMWQINESVMHGRRQTVSSKGVLPIWTKDLNSTLSLIVICFCESRVAVELRLRTVIVAHGQSKWTIHSVRLLESWLFKVN